PVTPGVAGSSPVRSAIYFESLAISEAFFVFPRYSGLRANESRLPEIPTALPPLSDPSHHAGVFLFVGHPLLRHGL
ncbi:hypothetical protein, partial [Vibrio sp. V39_P1S14PM300]|uniref:hypothetical protein n=1 Tax=Vibrio sp. V39_P1S14PM300 TaxID=1938690 RepID=UPI001F36C472